MQSKNDYIDWLGKNTKLAESSIVNYAGAIKTISEELIKEGLTETSLFYITDPKLMVDLKDKYLSIPKYNIKDKTGNRMYSNALRYFERYTESR